MYDKRGMKISERCMLSFVFINFVLYQYCFTRKSGSTVRKLLEYFFLSSGLDGFILMGYRRKFGGKGDGRRHYLILMTMTLLDPCGTFHLLVSNIVR